MSIQYSGGTIINTTFVTSTGTRAEIASNIITQLLAAGWVNVSGSGNDQVLKCATTAAGVTGLQVAARVYDPGSGNCARVALRNVSGSKIGQDLYLLPAAGKTFRIIANKYQFFCFVAGAPGMREAVCAGQVIVPSFLTSITTNAGFANGNATSDTDAVSPARSCFRSGVQWISTYNSALSAASTGRHTSLVADTLVEYSATAFSTGNAAGFPRVAAMGSDVAQVNGYRWSDGTLTINDALFASVAAAITDEAKFIGQLSDACVVNDALTLDSTVSLDGHTWLVVASSAGAVNASNFATCPRGSLLVAVT